jgi:hypothetical protein
MAEKKGNLGQLKYDFNTKWSTEVQLEDDGKWYRTTCREFRSFDGPRRIFLKNEEGVWEYVNYEGPIYMYDTNTKVVKNNTYKIIYVKVWEIEKRHHEKKWDI